MALVRLRPLPALLLVGLLSLGFSVAFAEGRAPGKSRIDLSAARALDTAKKGKCKRERRRCARRKRSSAGDRPIFWGALISDQINGEQVPWDMGGARQLEAMLGKRMSLIHFMAPFAQCPPSGCSYYRFPDEEMQTIRDHGAIPFFSWSSQAIPAEEMQPDFELSDVISGRYDAFIRDWARDARDWGHPFFLRFNWEMNGDWFSWSEGVNGNQRGEFVTAWRHVHDIVTGVGATNAAWVWCPNVDFEDKFGDLASLYPGDSYVDWTCLDGYNSGTNPAKKDRWRTFDQLYERTYQEIVKEVAPSKPMVIGEIASTEQGGSKAQWIAEMLDALPARYPKIRGLVWFDKFENGMDWPIETSASAIDAFAEGVRGRSYRGSAVSFGG
jgi:Glycosyl hydrolase family 26